MKILYVGLPGTASFSGPSVHVQEIIKGLSDRGHSLSYISPRPAKGNLLQQAWQRLLFSLEIGPRLWRERPDWVYQREQMADPFIAEMCRWLSIRYAVEINGLLVQELIRNGARWWTLKIAGWLQGWCLRRATVIVTAAAHWTTILSRQYRLDPARLHFVQNGVRLEEFRPLEAGECRRALGIGEDELVIGFLGSIYRNYDFKPTLQAIAQVRHKYPRLRLLVVGPGPRREALKKLITDLDLEAIVSLRESIPHRDAPRMLGAFDVCLMPYCEDVLRENNGMYSMKLQEYTASGRPLLAHDFVGSDSFEEANRFGWTFHPNDAAGAISALESALTSAEERAKRGRSGRSYAEGLSWDIVCAKIEAILETTARVSHS